MFSTSRRFTNINISSSKALSRFTTSSGAVIAASLRSCAQTASSSTKTPTPSSVGQQTDQDEYDAILKSAMSDQQNSNPLMADDSKASHRLLRIATPNIFEELKFVRDYNNHQNNIQQNNDNANDNNSNKTSSSSAVDEKRVILAKKYLSIDSPEIFNWVCSTCSTEFQAPVLERTLNDSGCPKCTAEDQGKRLADFRDLMMEVSPSNNDPFLEAEKLPVDSRKKLNWKCRTCGFDWTARVADRCAASLFAASGSLRAATGGSTGASCPRCSVRQSSGVAERLRLEWHPVKNGDLSPEATLVLSERKKAVWWLCSSCTHEWSAKVSSRFSGQGCPVCSMSGTAVAAAAAAGVPSSSAKSSNRGRKVQETGDAAEMEQKRYLKEQNKFRKAAIQEQEEADRENQYRIHMKQLEEHDRLKTMFSNTDFGAKQQQEQQLELHDTDEVDLGQESKSTSKQTTEQQQHRPAVTISRARLNPKREENLLFVKAAQEQKKKEYQTKKERDELRRQAAKREDEKKKKQKEAKTMSTHQKQQKSLNKMFSRAKGVSLSSKDGKKKMKDKKNKK